MFYGSSSIEEQKILDGWYEHLLNKQLNLCKNRSDLRKLKKISKNVPKCIGHILDCECYNIRKKVYLREVSIFNMKTDKVETYQIYYCTDEISANDKCDLI